MKWERISKDVFVSGTWRIERYGDVWELSQATGSTFKIYDILGTLNRAKLRAEEENGND